MRAMKESGIEWIGQIPKNWNTVRLGALASMIVPMRDKPTSFDGDIPWIRIEDFDGMYISKSKSEQNVSVELIKQMNMKIYPVGTVLCSCSCNLGKCAITTVPMCSNQTFIGVVPRGDLHNRFLYYVLSASEKILNNMSQGAIQSYLSQQDFSKFKIAITDFESQIKIADFLDKKCADIDAVIAAKEKANELLKERRQGIIYEAVTKGLNPYAPIKDSGIEWIGDIPENWSTTRVKFTSLLKGRIGWQGLKSDEYISEGPYLITGIDFSNGIIDWENCAHISKERFDEAPEIHIHEGDLLITKDGTVGKLAIAENCPQDVSLNSGVLLIRNKETGSYINKYLYYVLHSDIFWKWFKLSQNGNSTIIHLYQEQFSNFSYPLPSIDEQRDIVSYLDKSCVELDSLIDTNESTIQKLKEYRQSVIYEAVTGKIEV